MQRPICLYKYIYIYIYTYITCYIEMDVYFFDGVVSEGFSRATCDCQRVYILAHVMG